MSKFVDSISTSRSIRRAVIKDGISYIVGLVPGLSLIPIPFDTIETLIQFLRKRSPLNFTDWELRNWMSIYHQEIDSVIRLLYKGKEFLVPQVLIFDNTSEQLGLSQVKLALLKSPFQLRADVRALTEEPFEKLRAKLKYSDEQNLRLVDIVRDQDNLRLLVQSVNYQYYLHTNLVLDAHRGKTQTLREYLHSNGKLEDLCDSPLANNFGINMLLFTADGSLLMQKRSQKVAFRRGELCPSASGTLALIDVSTGSEIALTKTMSLREAFEEVNVKLEEVENVNLLGVTRELIRGGEPEMFLFAKTMLSNNDLYERAKTAKDSWECKGFFFYDFGSMAFETLEGEKNIHCFLMKVDELLEMYMKTASIPLLTAIALWTDYRLQGATKR